MSRYKQLFSNTILFAISNFGSKILLFLLMPLYTNILSTSEYGTADIIMNTVNLLYPILTLSISESCMRFALDNNNSKKQVFSNGLKIIFIGLIIVLMGIPILLTTGITTEYIVLCVGIYFFTALHTVMAQFLRGIDKVKLYAIDGIISSAILVISNIICLIIFDLGIKGYLISILLSKLIPLIILFVFGKLYHYIDFKCTDKRLLKEMISYSWPLIPNTLSWWVTTVSDRYIVIAYCGVAVNGLYSAAYKLPTILSLVVGIFMQAWQLSAVKEYGEGDTEKFYSLMYKYFTMIIFVGGSALIICTQFLSKILFAKDFYEAWRYVPFLIIAVVFNSSVSFLGSIYLATKKTKTVFMTSAVGAVANIILNFILIPHIGAIGAAIATMISYLVVWICRIIDTSKYVKLEIEYFKIILNSFLLILQSIVLVNEFKYFSVINIMLFIIIIIINSKEVISMIKMIYDLVSKKC